MNIFISVARFRMRRRARPKPGRGRGSERDQKIPLAPFKCDFRLAERFAEANDVDDRKLLIPPASELLLQSMAAARGNCLSQRRRTPGRKKTNLRCDPLKEKA